MAIDFLSWAEGGGGGGGGNGGVEAGTGGPDLFFTSKLVALWSEPIFFFKDFSSEPRWLLPCLDDAAALLDLMLFLAREGESDDLELLDDLVDRDLERDFLPDLRWLSRCLFRLPLRCVRLLWRRLLLLDDLERLVSLVLLVIGSVLTLIVWRLGDLDLLLVLLFTFRCGYDFCVAENSNMNYRSHSNLGNGYKHPMYNYRSNNAKSFLAGSFNFKTIEIEVFMKVKKCSWELNF